MASKGVDTLLELRRQLQEKRAMLVRQVCGNICYGIEENMINGTIY